MLSIPQAPSQRPDHKVLAREAGRLWISEAVVKICLGHSPGLVRVGAHLEELGVIRAVLVGLCL